MKIDTVQTNGKLMKTQRKAKGNDKRKGTKETPLKRGKGEWYGQKQEKVIQDKICKNQFVTYKII